MSAPAQRRTPLELVPEPDAAAAADTEWLTGDPAAAIDPATEEAESWQAATVLNQWAPEHQLIGALMWLTAEQASPILDLVPDTAIWQPLRQWAYEIIRSLAADGRDPNPVVVLAAARQQRWSLAPNPDQPTTPYQHHRLAVYLAAAYTQVISPAAAAGDYAREVLDEAYRRAFRDNGIRMQQLGGCGAERELIADQFAAIRDELAHLWRRAEAAAKPGWWR
jgi:replicative DNA helicase